MIDQRLLKLCERLELKQIRTSLISDKHFSEVKTSENFDVRNIEASEILDAYV